MQGRKRLTACSGRLCDHVTHTQNTQFMQQHTNTHATEQAGCPAYVTFSDQVTLPMIAARKQLQLKYLQRISPNRMITGTLGAFEMVEFVWIICRLRPFMMLGCPMVLPGLPAMSS